MIAYLPTSASSLLNPTRLGNASDTGHLGERSSQLNIVFSTVSSRILLEQFSWPLFVCTSVCASMCTHVRTFACASNSAQRWQWMTYLINAEQIIWTNKTRSLARLIVCHQNVRNSETYPVSVCGDCARVRLGISERTGKRHSGYDLSLEYVTKRNHSNVLAHNFTNHQKVDEFHVIDCPLDKCIILWGSS